MNCTMICITAIIIVATICGTVIFKDYIQSRNLERLIDAFAYEDTEALEPFKTFTEVIRSVGINLRKAVGDESNIERD